MRKRILSRAKIDQFLLSKTSPLDNKCVLVRVDFNVPILNGKVVNDFRIRKTLKTLKFLLSKNCRVVVMSHLGRPKRTSERHLYTLKPVWKHLAKYLKSPLFFCESLDETRIRNQVSKLKNGSLLLLENTRFYDLENQNRESDCDPKLAKFFASLGEYFVFEAFATSHRLHASTYGVLDYYEANKIFLGFLTCDEINLFHDYLDLPKRPLHLIIGGGKPESKLPLIGDLLPFIEKIIVCGALSYTFWKAKGYQVGNNPVTTTLLPKVKEWITNYKDKIVLPIDFSTNKKFTNNKPVIKDLIDLEADDLCLDCGPKSNQLFQKTLLEAKMIVWNGPPGIFEWSFYQEGTKNILQTLNKLFEQKKTQVIVGGGDSSASGFQFGYHETQFSHVSTGGGAFLLLLQTNNLPTIFKIISKN